MNAVEHERVETRVLNPTASEASYKPKQRSYRKTNLKKKVLASDSPGAEMSSARTAAPKRTRPCYLCTYFILHKVPTLKSDSHNAATALRKFQKLLKPLNGKKYILNNKPSTKQNYHPMDPQSYQYPCEQIMKLARKIR